ncbi:S1/P1 nuclease [Sphingobium aquiterrae]|uniref:S1/P1 nuclease n=1 Tax=Sphingobium aquiterrae TaxID=2038656 RepID=UPI0030193FDD
MTRLPLKLLPLLALLAAFMPTPALAWWEYGHETIAQIAQANVTPRTRAAIAALLRHAPDMATPTCPLKTIENASVWPDCIKELKDRFSYQYNWHYQNVDICKPFDLKAACPDGNCVSAQIDRNARLLKDRTLPARERLMALAFLVHFVGDLHQPLHAGDNGDLGGNRVKADYGIVQNNRLNLHSIWDGYLAERGISAPPSLVRHYSAEEKTAMGGGTTEDWSRESWALSRDMAYAPVRNGEPCRADKTTRGTLSEQEIEALVPVVRQQMERGGLRLARLLDEALD